MAEFCVNGLIVREVPYSEADKILTVLTAQMGKITVYAKRVRHFKNRYQATAQLMSYNEFVLYSRNDFYYLKEASVIENFYPIRQDLDRFALAQYFLDVAGDVCVEGESQEAMLQLLLNSLYLLSKNEKPLPLIKGVFELRTMVENGWMPALEHCDQCGKTAEKYYFDLPGGVLCCPDCRKAIANMAIPPRGEDGIESRYAGYSDFVEVVEGATLDALRYVERADRSRIFAFTLEPKTMQRFATVCERYLLNQLERSFSTLQFYHSLKHI